MRTMLATAVLLQLAANAVLFAEDGKKFEEHKAKVLQRVETRLSRLNEHKNCIASATKKEELKACREKMKAWHDANRKEHEEHE